MFAGAPRVTQPSLYFVSGVFIYDFTKRAAVDGLEALPSGFLPGGHSLLQR